MKKTELKLSVVQPELGTRTGGNILRIISWTRSPILISEGCTAFQAGMILQ